MGELATIDSGEIARRVTGLLEVDAKLPLGALSRPGRGSREFIFGRYLAAYLMVERFDIQIEHAAILLHRDRGTVTKAMKVFKFLEGYQGWRQALLTLGDMAENFVCFAEQRQRASHSIPAPVGRDGKNDKLPSWIRERYAQEIEVAGEIDYAQARAQDDIDTMIATHPAVRAIADDPEVHHLIGIPVVSATISPLDEPNAKPGQRPRPILLVPSVPGDGIFTLRLLCPGDTAPLIAKMREARALIQSKLMKLSMRLTGVADTYPARERKGWRYMPLYITLAKT